MTSRFQACFSQPARSARSLFRLKVISIAASALTRDCSVAQPALGSCCPVSNTVRSPAAHLHVGSTAERRFFPFCFSGCFPRGVLLPVYVSTCTRFSLSLPPAVWRRELQSEQPTQPFCFMNIIVKLLPSLPLFLLNKLSLLLRLIYTYF